MILVLKYFYKCAIILQIEIGSEINAAYGPTGTIRTITCNTIDVWMSWAEIKFFKLNWGMHFHAAVVFVTNFPILLRYSDLLWPYPWNAIYMYFYGQNNSRAICFYRRKIILLKGIQNLPVSLTFLNSILLTDFFQILWHRY